MAISTDQAPVITSNTYGKDLNRPGYVADTNGITGIREDLSSIIADVSPTETPFFSKCGKQKVTNTYTEWQTSELRDAELNAHVEGADSGAEFTPTVRVGNYTQIGKGGFRVSGTAQSVNTAGRSKEYAYQVLQRGKELKRDLEVALLGTQARSPGSATTARIMAGVGAWISTNTIGDATFPTVADGTGTFAAGGGERQLQLGPPWLQPLRQGEPHVAAANDRQVHGRDGCWGDAKEIDRFMPSRT